MALTRSHRSPLDLVRLAGCVPATAALVLALACTGSAQAQGPEVAARPVSVSTPGQPIGRPSGQPEGPQVRVSEHNTVDLHVKDEDLLSVLELLSIQTQRNIIASKNVSARVTAALYNVTFYEALDAILHVNGFGYIEQGNFIYVYTLQEIDEIQKALSRRVARVMHLNYINAADAADFVKPLISQGGEVRTSAKADNFAIPENAPVGGENWALGATLVVFDYEQNIEAIERLLAELDTKPAQVLVEATVLQTALTEANAFGVDFSIIGSLNFTDFLRIGGPRRVTEGLILGGDGQTPGQGFSPPDNRGVAVSGTPGNTEGRASFKVGVVQDDIAIFLRMLDEVSDTTIISNPKILALNRMPARVLVGRRVGYLNTTATETSTTQTVAFLDTGTQLYFRPFVARDDSIRMELKPQVSEAIIRQASDATGAAVSIPDEVTQEITTNVIVRDGQTIVLGGLFRESTQFVRRQVPFLGDLPFIGAAFRGHDDDTDRSEIIFMITPTIVNDAIIDQAAMRASQDIERIRAGSRQGLLPWSREKMTSVANLEAEHLAREGKYEQALWQISRSLSLNPFQPEAYRLRERITGEAEIWPHRSMLEDVMGDETARAMDRVTPPSNPQPHYNPSGSWPVPREHVAPPALRPDEPLDDLPPLGEMTPEPSKTPPTAGASTPKAPVAAASTPEPVVEAEPAQNSRASRQVSAAAMGIAPVDGGQDTTASGSGAAPANGSFSDALLDQEFNQARFRQTASSWQLPQPIFSPWFGGLTSQGFSTALESFSAAAPNWQPADEPGGNSTITNVPTGGER